MSADLPTHRDLARAAKVTVTTIKSYRRKFPEFFPVASQGKPIRFDPKAVKAALAVSRHFRAGLAVEVVRARLVQELGPPETPPPAPVSRPESARATSAPATSAPATSVQAASGPTASGPTTSVPPAPGEAKTPSAEIAGLAAPPRAPDSLARVEALLDGLFSLQNRTHSLMAELVAKLDTLADRLGPASPARAIPAPPEGTRPPADLLALPVVIQGASGQYLGVTTKAGSPFSLDQFENYLRRRARGLGCPASAWSACQGSWVLTLTGPGQTHEHHFRLARTPRGNTVALFHQLVVGGKVVSEAFLQTFLRQVKETLDA